MNDVYQNVSTLGYGELTAEVWEIGTPRSRVKQAVDTAHAQNMSGAHRSGFCEACADRYVAACHEFYTDA
jgi:hypothetical protein